MLNYKIVGDKSNRYNEIQFLKGFSIFTIVVMHLLQLYIKGLPRMINLAVSFGGTGVHIFFFCSGFGLYLSHLKKPLGFRQFIKRRFLKIYIPYIIIVFISFCLPYMYENSDRVQALLSHIFMYKMFIPKYESSFGGQLWYVSTIFQVYLIFSLLCHIKDIIKSKKIFVLLALISSVFWWLFVSHVGFADERIWNSFFLQYLWEFVLGMCVAEHLFQGGKLEINKLFLLVLGFGGIGCAGALKILGGKAVVFNDIPAMIGYMSLALFIYSFGIKWINDIFIKMSYISYEWYLVHIVVFSTVFLFANGVFIQRLIMGLVAFALSILVAKLYSMLIKKVLHKKCIF